MKVIFLLLNQKLLKSHQPKLQNEKIQIQQHQKKLILEIQLKQKKRKDNYFPLWMKVELMEMIKKKNFFSTGICLTFHSH
jgi:hypothetical protein